MSTSILQFESHCTVFGCRMALSIEEIRRGDNTVMARILMQRLQSLNWGIDKMGMICPEHIPTHKIGPLLKSIRISEE